MGKLVLHKAREWGNDDDEGEDDWAKLGTTTRKLLDGPNAKSVWLVARKPKYCFLRETREWANGKERHKIWNDSTILFFP